MTETDREELQILADRLLAIAEAKAGLQSPPEIEHVHQATTDDRALASIAALELKRRALRSQYLPASMFAEGVWSILLDLFVAEHEGRNVSVISASIASQVPATTALRVIVLLVEQGLVSASNPGHDNQARLLKLTARGLTSIRSILQEYSR